MLLRWKILRMFNSGITTKEDYSRQNHIRVINLVFAASGLSTLLMAILFFIVGYFPQGLACVLNAAFFFIPFHLNSKGWHLLSKIITTLFTNCTLLLWCCVFTHQVILNTYFLFMATACIYIYRRDEGIWIFFLVIFSLCCFVVESTYLKDFLPSMNLIRSNHQLNITNFILLTGLICLLISHIGSFVFLAALREKKLSNTKKWLTLSRERLAEQNQDLKTFGAAASHFLQTPLYVIRLYIDRFKHANAADYTPKEEQYFVLIDESLTQMEEFIKGLFSQYNIMEINTKNETIDVLEEMIKIRNVLLQKFPQAAIVLPNERIKIQTNRILLIIIMQNVIENGLKYNDALVPKMDISYITKADSHSFLFKDNGIGIDDAYREKIFSPFMRIDHNKYIGTGLGLAGAKRAAEAINGDLYCEASDSNGSTFRLNIKIK